MENLCKLVYWFAAFLVIASLGFFSSIGEAKDFCMKATLGEAYEVKNKNSLCIDAQRVVNATSNDLEIEHSHGIDVIPSTQFVEMDGPVILDNWSGSTVVALSDGVHSVFIVDNMSSKEQEDNIPNRDRRAPPKPPPGMTGQTIPDMGSLLVLGHGGPEATFANRWFQNEQHKAQERARQELERNMEQQRENWAVINEGIYRANEQALLNNH